MVSWFANPERGGQAIHSVNKMNERCEPEFAVSRVAVADCAQIQPPRIFRPHACMTDERATAQLASAPGSAP